MKKFIAIILALTLTTALFAGCSSNSFRTDEAEFGMMASSKQSAAAAPAPAAAPAAGLNDFAVAEEAAMDMEDTLVESPATGGGGDGGIAGPAVDPVVDSRKIIKNVNMQLQTLSFDSAVDSIARISESFGGYIQDSYVEGRDMYNERGTRTANFTIRIPSDALDSFVNSLGGDEFNVISKSQNSEDVTERYFDSKARLDALKVQEERLMAMLETAAELEYLLQVEKELMNVRYEIESLTSSLKRLDSYVSLSTVSVFLYEVVKYEPVENVPVTFGERISRAFAYSWESFSEFSQNFTVSLISVLPFLLLLLVIVLIVLLIIRRNGKRSVKKAGGKNIPAVNMPVYVAPPIAPAPDKAPGPDDDNK